MKFSSIALSLGLAAAASAQYSNGTDPSLAPSLVPVNLTTVAVVPITTWVTDIVTEYTTYCPYPTTLVEGDKTYVVTEATTLTVTDCPCTRTSAVVTETTVTCVGQTVTKTKPVVSKPVATVPASVSPVYTVQGSAAASSPVSTVTEKTTKSVPQSSASASNSTSGIDQINHAGRASFGAAVGVVAIAALLL
ncbi:hypothetical protein NADFUDRAFT_45354 [Nadsonia fulvescens var. elongata DSM 6958]|uniref:Cell wall protein SED1 n=1 Tax=Nadsonia fulvescens var. elongata DSM 6958 TaxID=857566 RepID=A0A1E3PP07_9ASCO|nr:hypothetical protein NADFUDRAFT_45354 [Nadsonia fulvescens var. elongata DSM 6958]